MYLPWPPLEAGVVLFKRFIPYLILVAATLSFSHVAHEPLVSARNYPAPSIIKYKSS